MMLLPMQALLMRCWQQVNLMLLLLLQSTELS
jgi:hypothetical protein